jgi:hypothetical protein
MNGCAEKFLLVVLGGSSYLPKSLLKRQRVQRILIYHRHKMRFLFISGSPTKQCSLGLFRFINYLNFFEDLSLMLYNGSGCRVGENLKMQGLTLLLCKSHIVHYRVLLYKNLFSSRIGNSF